jgi:hypothetical protein
MAWWRKRFDNDSDDFFDAAQALGVSEDRIQCGLPQPSSPLLCDVDILGPTDVSDLAENGGPQNLVKRLR